MKKLLMFSGAIIALVVIICFIAPQLTNKPIYTDNGFSLAGGIENKYNEYVSYPSNIDDFEVEGDDISFNFFTRNDNEKDAKYVLTFIINFEQQLFFVDENKEKVSSYTFDLNMHESKTLKITMDKSIFDCMTNVLVANLRGDVDNLLESIEIRRTTTFNICYNIINTVSEKDISDVIKNSEGTVYDRQACDERGNVPFVDLRVVNSENNFLSKVKSGDMMSLEVDAGGENDYVLVAYLNSEQVTVNGKRFEYFKGPEKMSMDTIDIDIKAPDIPGDYGLQVYKIPVIYSGDDNDYMFESIVSNSYIIKVE